ncbi:zinc finger CCCH domain-containing protein 66-like [Nymphaea colorata]|nr:zinc finger CCCH domain-containing protein 66-like [Nymphaea colorata]XP_031485801.1 zinc finger CCCH domain-containing protein 66-like [Nymphaea colorata]
MCGGPEGLKKQALRCGMEDAGFCVGVSKVTTACSALLELSASDDLIGFKQAVEEDGSAIDEASFWYGGSSDRKMGFVQRTPLMIAALFGSTDVLKYIISTYSTCGIDVNRASVSDGATALHCAASGGSPASAQLVKLLLEASADVNSVDAIGNRPGDLIPTSSPVLSKSIDDLKSLLNVNGDGKSSPVARTLKSGVEKKEYPVDLSMPDIKNGVYSTDEFRMYTFKVKPCSRAYSHDWTECPFAHPGENARRRDPRRYHYSCVPCPDFRKGACRRGDACEYAHGVFECWLHPAQYRTRLCKDETNCTRRVCFFAHKPEELRSLYPSTGSALPSPRSMGLDSPVLNPLTLNSPSVLLGTPPMSPSASIGSSSSWQQLGGCAGGLQASRLRAALSARDLTLDDLVELEGHQQLLDDLAAVAASSSPPLQQPRLGSLAAATALAASAGSRSGKFRNISGSAMHSANLEDMFASDVLSQMAAADSAGFDHNSILSLKAAAAMAQMQSTMRPNVSYGIPSSPVRASSPHLGVDLSCGSSSPMMSPALATAVMNSSRSAAFAKRSQSFCDRGAAGVGLTTPTTLSKLSNWSSPNGKLDWGVQGEELNKLRKSASFGIRSSGGASAPKEEEPDVSWVQSLVKDVPPGFGHNRDGVQNSFQGSGVSGSGGSFAPWVEQLYMEQEQMVA